jgi:hypothetical protein
MIANGCGLHPFKIGRRSAARIKVDSKADDRHYLKLYAIKIGNVLKRWCPYCESCSSPLHFNYNVINVKIGFPLKLAKAKINARYEYLINGFGIWPICR